MGLTILMAVAICIREQDVLSPHDFATSMLRTDHVAVSYFLASIFLVLLVMRGIAILASTSRQLLAIGRCSGSKALSFLGDTDGSPAPRSALAVIAFLTAGIGSLTLLRDYRVVFEQIRRLGALCTLSSYIICIAAVCIPRYRTRTTIPSNNRLESFSRKLGTINGWFALLICILLFLYHYSSRATCSVGKCTMEPVGVALLQYGASCVVLAIRSLRICYQEKLRGISNLTTERSVSGHIFLNSHGDL